jgi:hypothetical protein
MNLEPGVGAGDLPTWPVVIQEREKYTFGSCRLPLGEYKGEQGQNAYVRNAPLCTPSKGWLKEQPNTVDAVEHDSALMVANCHHVETLRIHIQPDGVPSDTPVEVQYSATAHDTTMTMVWTGYARATSVPIHVRGAPDPCLVYRRIVEDLVDNNVTIDDTHIILWSRAHLARELCETPRELAITML